MKRYRSVAEMFLARVTATPTRRAFSYPTDSGGWATLTWEQTAKRVRAVASGLRALGIQDEDRCAILSGTRLDWLLADLGILCAGAATTTIYPASTSEECAFILKDSGARLAFVEDASQLEKLLAQRAALPELKAVVIFDGAASTDGWVQTFEQLEAVGRTYDQTHPGEFEKGVQNIEPDRLATLIYTSGTTGQPKGVELTHDNWVFEAEGIDALNLLNIDDHQYLWLPLAHSFGKVLEATQLAIGFETTVDGRVAKLIENLAVVRPTFMAAAPRIFEKVYNKVMAGAAEGGKLKQTLFEWSVGVGRKTLEAKKAKQPVPLRLRLQHLVADRLVFSKLRARFGGRLRFFVSGSAPLSKDIGEFFQVAGIYILEGYGLTESSAGSFVNTLENFELGTVGAPVKGLEVRFAEDGEILLRGRGIMRGYRHLPEDSAQALDAERWLHTGDIGELDAAGRLRITDRKKDLIKTSGGKYVAPQALESRLKSLCPYLSQVVIHGDGRNFCSALVTLDEETVKGWLTERGLQGLSAEERSKHPEVRALVQQAVDALNHVVARHETLKRFSILPVDLSVENGELTPSLKVKRKWVEKRYREVLDSLYT